MPVAARQGFRYKRPMVEPPHETQRIERLMPLAEAQACIDRLVRPFQFGPASKTCGLVTAYDVTAPDTRPQGARALRDGLAVRAEETLDASPYAPVRVDA